MDHTLVPLFARLEKVAVSGPGKHELARIFFALPKTPFHLVDNYGRVWIREQDFERVREAVLPAVAANDQ